MGSSLSLVGFSPVVVQGSREYGLCGLQSWGPPVEVCRLSCLVAYGIYSPTWDQTQISCTEEQCLTIRTLGSPSQLFLSPQTNITGDMDLRLMWLHAATETLSCLSNIALPKKESLHFFALVLFQVKI